MITDGRRLDAIRKRICPGCGAAGLIPGPRGGASQNMFCGQCGQGWNVHGVDYGVMGYEPIGKTDPRTFALYASAAAKLKS
jgi:hypothetical protein